MRPIRRDIQIIYQDPYESLDPRFRVRARVEEPLLIHGVGGSRAERKQLVTDALERAGLTPPDLYLDRFAHELSGGQRQRVAIAAALVLEAEAAGRRRAGVDARRLGAGGHPAAARRAAQAAASGS